ncbi:hypothetical protein HQO26_11475 [Rhodococcus fascians]|nr:hypothetical protein [Rhodococcus fascians]MBY4415148.1 hypothetical protein [Rhodococcus fascians]
MDELRILCDEWSLSNPGELAKRVAADGWFEWYLAAGSREAPAELPALAGEAIYSLRSALDQAVWSLILACGGTPNDKNTYFPIAKTEATWSSMEGNYLRGASSDAVEAIRAWQPVYRTPEEPLADLLALVDEFGLVDKHRLLYTSVNRLDAYDIKLFGEATEDRPRTLERRERPPHDALLLDGDEWILRARIVLNDGSNTVDPSFPLDIDVTSIGLRLMFQTTVRSGSVVGVPPHTLSKMVDHVETVLNDLARFL